MQFSEQKLWKCFGVLVKKFTSLNSVLSCYCVSVWHTGAVALRLVSKGVNVKSVQTHVSADIPDYEAGRVGVYSVGSIYTFTYAASTREMLP